MPWPDTSALPSQLGDAVGEGRQLQGDGGREAGWRLDGGRSGRPGDEAATWPRWRPDPRPRRPTPWPDLDAAGRAVAAGLVVPVLLRGATVPVDLDELTAAERRQLPEAKGLRRQDWLLGRAALKQVVEGGDTSQVRFPHRCLSLTHAAGLAVAARADGDQAGVGVDYEGPHDTDPRIARLFLVERERDAATGPDDLLRLWTVKEALFKATPDNLGATFLDYEVAEPAALIGQAADRTGRRLRYVSGGFGGGWLSVAVSDAAV